MKHETSSWVTDGNIGSDDSIGHSRTTQCTGFYLLMDLLTFRQDNEVILH